MTAPAPVESLAVLHGRRAFCLLCIQTVSGADPSDSRREPAIAEYNRQLASIDVKIAAITGQPPDTVVGLKPAVLFPKVGAAQ